MNFYHIQKIGVFLSYFLPIVAEATCSLSNTSIQFGGYNVFDPFPKNIVGTIEVNCAEVTHYNLKISTGAGSYQQRFMQNGSEQLNYNLYTDANRQIVWGDDFGQSSMQTAEHSGRMVHDVYGQIPARQNVLQGQYHDVLILTLDY